MHLAEPYSLEFSERMETREMCLLFADEGEGRVCGRELVVYFW